MTVLDIQLKNIRKSFNRPVLNSINLNIDNNSFISIVGKSGSGKSTLMNILGLIEYFDDGEYLFNDILIDNKKDYSKIRLEEIGFIFQNYNLIPSLSCRENILLPSLYYEKEHGDLSTLVKKLDIDHLLDTSVNVLSGGEKQRVAIARALILNPKLIIADEPTGNLDKVNKEIVLDLLEDIHKDGCGVVIITHDLNVASRGKKLYELKGGCLHEMG